MFLQPNVADCNKPYCQKAEQTTNTFMFFLEYTNKQINNKNTSQQNIS